MDQTSYETSEKTQVDLFDFGLIQYVNTDIVVYKLL